MTYTSTVLSALSDRGLKLPQNLPKPAGNYEPFRLEAGTGYLAAQVSGYDDPRLLGRVGLDVSIESGVAGAERAALFSLARIHQALDGFDRLVGLLHVAGHVSSADDFLDQPRVLDGASDLFIAVLGERGKHSRTAYHHSRLPRNIMVELEITFAYRA